MRQTPRTRRLSDRVTELVAQILAEDLSDPRLDLVTVTGADVAPDVSFATVYVIAHGDEERYAEVLAGLESAKGRIRTLVGRGLQARVTPELRFRIDPSVDAGMRMNEALRNVPPTLAGREDDAEHIADDSAEDDA